MMPPPYQPPPSEQWPIYQADHLRRQTSALESIRLASWLLVALFGVFILPMAVLLATT
jgi:hypothetical protein